MDKDKEMHPYTDCQAMEHGWRWRIPTQSRMGTGYCFNRSITSPDTVAKDFVKHWDNRISEDDLKLLDWKPQRCKQFWKGNVVSIGLSGGFIETLESTGYFISFIYLYALCFEKIHLTKPHSSNKKSGEFYLVGYKRRDIPDKILEYYLKRMDDFKINQPLFYKKDLPEDFYFQILWVPHFYSIC